MANEFKIRNVKNGIILTCPDGGEVVFGEQDDEKSEHCSFASFLIYLSDEYGPSDSRYSPERIYIQVAPGDKNENNKGCPFCLVDYSS